MPRKKADKTEEVMEQPTEETSAAPVVPFQTELNAAIAHKAAAFGEKSVLSALVESKANMVILATTCAPDKRAEILHWAKLSNVRVEQTNLTGRQLGVLCGKPFSIAAAVILTGERSR
jgi:large subunit ribosomal protein L30e